MNQCDSAYVIKGQGPDGRLCVLCVCVAWCQGVGHGCPMKPLFVIITFEADTGDLGEKRCDCCSLQEQGEPYNMQLYGHSGPLM